MPDILFVSYPLGETKTLSADTETTFNVEYCLLSVLYLYTSPATGLARYSASFFLSSPLLYVANAMMTAITPRPENCQSGTLVSAFRISYSRFSSWGMAFSSSTCLQCWH